MQYKVLPTRTNICAVSTLTVIDETAEEEVAFNLRPHKNIQP